MGVMENTWYLPEEKLHYRNYPEVYRLAGDIDKLMGYGLVLADAVTMYNEGEVDKIDIDIARLQNHINLCRQVCEVLGKAPKVCYDILLELRELQGVMQTLMYVRNRFGNQYVGKPTENASEVNSNMIG